MRTLDKYLYYSGHIGERVLVDDPFKKRKRVFILAGWFHKSNRRDEPLAVLRIPETHFYKTYSIHCLLEVIGETKRPHERIMVGTGEPAVVETLKHR